MTVGATPQDWAAWQRLGVESDLLPVVMDQAAKISANSNIRDLGKTPSRFNRAGEVAGFPQWTSNVATAKDVARWAADTRLGICVIARQVKAIDIDIDDPTVAKAVEDFVELVLGKLPARRRANSGKMLLAFRLPVPFPKRVIHTAHGIIELLSERQQFVAAGTHKSGCRYEWDAGSLDALPELTLAELDEVWAGLAKAFGLPGGSVEDRNGLIPTVPRRAEDMQDPMVAWLAENGWVTEHRRDGNVNVRCPWESEHTVDSGVSATTWFAAGVADFKQGHFKCQHSHCKGRTDGDFLEAVGYVASEFAVVEAPKGADGNEVRPLPPFTRARNGQIEAVLNNVLMALRRPDICGARLAFDEFRAALMICDEGSHEFRPFTDHDYLRLCSRLEEGLSGFKSIELTRLRGAAHLVGWENRMDSAKAWVESLEWDGVERVPTFWSEYFRTADTPYTRAAALYTWTALAGRAAVPGLKCDMVPVLVGAQNAGKTTGVQAIAPHLDTFAEISLDVRDDDLARKMRGTLVGELGELRGLEGRDEDAIKQWISRTHEEWTPKFLEYTTKFARRLVMFGTVNRDDFLVDETGNRRWLPMRVGEVDVEAIRRDRDQLWAEGLRRFKAGGVAWRDAQTLAKDEHAAFKATDPWTDAVRNWLHRDGMDERSGTPRGLGNVRLVDVLVSGLGVNMQRITRKEERRVGKILRELGYEKTEAVVEGERCKVWRVQGSARSAFGWSDLA